MFSPSSQNTFGVDITQSPGSLAAMNLTFASHPPWIGQCCGTPEPPKHNLEVLRGTPQEDHLENMTWQQGGVLESLWPRARA